MNKTLKFISLIALIFWTAFIWHYSLEDAIESSHRSQEIAEAINEALEPEVEVTEHSVRKTAHFVEFMVEGVLALLCARSFCGKGLFREGKGALAARECVVWIAALLAGLLVALTDETAQLFSYGRSAQVSDIWLDFVGFICGCLTCRCVGVIITIIHGRKDG